MNRRTLRVLGAFSAVAVLCLTVHGYADETQELKRVKERLEKERSNLKELVAKKVSILDRVDDLDQKISSLSRESRLLEKEVQALQTKIQGIEQDIVVKDEDLVRRRGALHHRVSALYQMGNLGTLKVLFSADNFSDLLQRNDLLSRVIRHDLQAVESYNHDLAELRSLRNELSDERQRLKESQEEAKSKRHRLAGEKEQKSAVVAAISSEEEIHKKYIDELEEASGRLEKLLKEIAKRKKREKSNVVERGFAARRGTLHAPVHGKVVKKFGKFRDPKFFTYQFNKGIEIGSEYGSDVKAVYDGQVVFSGWFKGFGQLVIVDHGGGYYTLSAYNQELFKRTGESVAEGEVIARLPDRSGQEARPRLYFEVREKGSSLDPLTWLSPSDFLLR